MKFFCGECNVLIEDTPAPRYGIWRRCNSCEHSTKHEAPKKDKDGFTPDVAIVVFVQPAQVTGGSSLPGARTTQGFHRP
jgi:hypothetical protein